MRRLSGLQNQENGENDGCSKSGEQYPEIVNTRRKLLCVIEYRLERTGSG